MKGRDFIWIALLCLSVFAGGVAIGQDPGLWARHPVLADADHACHIAMDKVAQAQGANPADPAGHMQRAKDLLFRAEHEIGAAAVAADQMR
jgi:hypothetical protein